MRFRVVMLALACLLVSRAAEASQPGLDVLYSFHGYDGDFPVGRLAIDASGNLYGVTAGGGHGQGFAGVVFEVSPDGTATVLHNFHDCGCVDGALPQGGLVIDAAGNLYGTTAMGGNSVNGGGGTVFEMLYDANTASWSEKILYNFCSQLACADGNAPFGDLTMDMAGNLYGMTGLGGAPTTSCQLGCGVIFQLHPNADKTVWTEKVLHRFHAPTVPRNVTASGYVGDRAGNLYGTTPQGGDSPNCGNGCGTVFKLTYQ